MIVSERERERVRMRRRLKGIAAREDSGTELKVGGPSKATLAGMDTHEGKIRKNIKRKQGPEITTSGQVRYERNILISEKETQNLLHKFIRSI